MVSIFVDFYGISPEMPNIHIPWKNINCWFQDYFENESKPESLVHGGMTITH